MHCRKCGALVKYGINICPACGSIMPEENYILNLTRALPKKQETKTSESEFEQFVESNDIPFNII